MDKLTNNPPFEGEPEDDSTQVESWGWDWPVRIVSDPNPMERIARALEGIEDQLMEMNGYERKARP